MPKTIIILNYNTFLLICFLNILFPGKKVEKKIKKCYHKRMIENFFNQLLIFSRTPPSFSQFLFLFLFSFWNLFWKGWALWKSAKRGEKKWFIALIILQTFGILDIIYLFIFSRKKKAGVV
ncbi:MAG: DUF5652 family protein [Minisyncoccales bacterium]